MQENSARVEVQKMNAWVTKEQKEFLRTKADIRGTSISAILRECVEMYQNADALNSNIDKICEIIDMQIDRSFKKNLDRLIKLVVKTAISAESANHNSAEILSKIIEEDITEVKDRAYHYAINYIKKKGD